MNMCDYSQDILSLNRIKDVARKVAEKYHAAEVFLFGSYARIDEKPMTLTGAGREYPCF